MEISVQAILAKHDFHAAPGALPDSLGDGFLMLVNPMYRKVRETSLARQIRFSSTHPEITPVYKALSLFALPRMERHRVVGYVDNVSALRALVCDVPAFAIAPDVLASSLYPNALLHEAVHVLTRQPTPTCGPLAEIDCLLCEAFAMAIQTYAAASQPVTSGAEMLLARLNGLHPAPANMQVLLAGERASCKRTTLAILVLGCLVHLLGSPLECVDPLVDELQLPEAWRASPWLIDVFRLGFGHSTAFSSRMQKAYMRYIGLGEEYDAVMDSAPRVLSMHQKWTVERIQALGTMFV